MRTSRAAAQSTRVMTTSPALRHLLPIFESPLDRASLAYVAALAALHPIELILLDVVSDEGLLDEADRRLTDLTSCATSDRVEVTKSIQIGELAPTVADAAQMYGVDLISFVSDRSSDLDGGLNGDLATSLMQISDTPLLVVPPYEPSPRPRVLVIDHGDVAATMDPFVGQFVEATGGEMVLSDVEKTVPAVADAAQRGGANLVVVSRADAELFYGLRCNKLGVLVVG